MKLDLLKPAKSLNKAYFKQSLKREQIELFKSELQKTFNHIDEKQDEEYHKNVISKLLLEVYCKDKYLVNVNKKQDLVIRNGNKTNDEVAVIIEFKKPTEKKDMVSKDKANVKALQELVLYYLRETIDHDNHKIKYLIATNIYEWFIFDELWFEKNIFKNTKLKTDYENWKVSGHNTQHFYDLTAARYLDSIDEEVPCTYFNLKDFEKIISNYDKEDDNALIDLYKILSPEHLLKKPFANDSNSLNKEFYTELLHIIGLEETKVSAKKLIERKELKHRDEGSLLENTINILQREKRFGYDDDIETQHKYFELALELCIAWLNRILFLKLLEGQLIKYHRGDKSLSFLNHDMVKDFDELDELFFEVLAVSPDKRSQSVTDKFGNLPYLNSSLFEPTDVELNYIFIRDLKDRLEIPIYNSTVFKDNNGKRITGKKNTLQYLFEFLEAYDFASEGKAKIQEQNKNIINASVLGLIFEKINGYKDGSFFTPGFITMYMCRETIRKTVLQKFNEANNWECKTFDDIEQKLDHTDKEQRKQANNVINSIKICDPAVGSGHFLVSALNELIAIKSDLHILNYRDGNRVKGFKIAIANDELIITNEEDDQLFDYTLNQNNKPIEELQKLQETLFHEKQTIIENCLFGVDINPKSVMICRLRLWVELLKNSYYRVQTLHATSVPELETLPNIDINIKCGNSLISRFAIDDKNSLLPKDRPYVKQLIERFKILVDGYKNATDKRSKDNFRKQIGYIKTVFEKFAVPNDKQFIQLKELKDKLGARQFSFFFDEEEKKKWIEETEKLSSQVAELERQYTEKLKTIYGNSFEWRFEFPEVLDEDGQFVGFDVVIGNPPYGVKFKDVEKVLFKDIFKDVHTRTPESFNYFIRQFTNISTKKGYCTLIVPSSFLNQAEFEKARKIILDNYSLYNIVNLGDNVFDDVATPTCIMGFTKIEQNGQTKYLDLTALDRTLLTFELQKTDKESLVENSELKENQSFSFIYQPHKSILDKCYKNIPTLKDVAEEVATGISPGLGEAFILDKGDAEKLALEKEIIKKLVIGGEINRFNIKADSDKVIIYFSAKLDIKRFPNCLSYLEKYKIKLENRVETKQGTIPWFVMLRPRRQKLFDESKILIRQTANKIMAAYDDEKWYCLKSGIIIQLPANSRLSYNYLLGILNSTLMDFLYQDLVNEQNRIFPEVKPIQLFKLPIKIAESESQNEIMQIVDKIIEAKKTNPQADTNELEKEIDQMVYKLYDLTYDEVRVIDPAFALSEAEYEAKNV